MAKEQKGLIKFRAVTGKEPTYLCPNCKCKRYSPCGCEVSTKKQKTTQEATDGTQS